jgi:DNA polymerase-4
MPLREAGRRCPHGIFLPGRMKRYMEVSARIREVMLEYTPLVEPLSLDEAFLDVTASQKLFGPAEQIAKTLIQRINKEVGLPASVGVAHNKFLAKLGSDLKKPKGFVVIPSEGVEEFLAPLPVSRLWGVGPKTAELLHKLGIQTIGDLQRIPLAQIRSRLGESGEALYKLAYGIDERPVIPEEEAKSIGHEVTFSVDTGDRDLLEGTLLGLCERVARRMRKHGIAGRIITVKLRNADFKTITRRLTLPTLTDFEEVIFSHALGLAKEADWGGKRLRLIGVSVSGLQKGSEQQIPLFLTEDHEGLKRLHETVDLIRDRFGESAITRGRLLSAPQEGEAVAFREKKE